MRPDQRKELGLVILYSLMVIFIPLIIHAIFPNDFSFSILSGRIYALFLFEFIWYSILLLIMLRLASGLVIFLQALACIVYRLTLGVIFGLLIMVGGEVSWQLALNKGIWLYSPTLFIQVIFTPFILRGFFNQMILWDMRKKDILYEAPQRDMHVVKPQESKDATVGSVVETDGVDLMGPLRYIKEYNGVENVFLVDNEGLIVARATSQQTDDERLAPFMLGLEELNNKALKKINEKKANRIELYTPSHWINLTRIFNLILVTVANRYTDDLLNVRIVQAAEMIKKYMRKRYTQEVLTEVEDQNV